MVLWTKTHQSPIRIKACADVAVSRGPWRTLFAPENPRYPTASKIGASQISWLLGCPERQPLRG